MQNYILIAQDRPQVELFSRQDDADTWLYKVSKGLSATVTLHSLNCTIALDDVYAQIAFDDKI